MIGTMIGTTIGTMIGTKMGGDNDRDNDRDNDGKMTSITRERQAATVPQVPLYFLAVPAPFVVAPSGASCS